MFHIKQHCYRSHPSINPHGIVPVGPNIDFSTKHDRYRFKSGWSMCAEQFVNINKLVFSSSTGNGSASRDPSAMCFVLWLNRVVQACKPDYRIKEFSKFQIFCKRKMKMLPTIESLNVSSPLELCSTAHLYRNVCYSETLLWSQNDCVVLCSKTVFRFVTHILSVHSCSWLTSATVADATVRPYLVKLILQSFASFHPTFCCLTSDILSAIPSGF